MAKIIIANYPDYEIETDYTVGYCKRFNETSPITNCNCFECKVSECTGQVKHKVDVMVENPAADFYAYYVFNQLKDKSSPKDLHYINSSKSLFKNLNSLKYDIEQYDRYRLEYLDRCDSLKEYVTMFAKTLKSDYFDLLAVDCIPIIFHDEMKDYSEITTGVITAGDVSSKLFQLTINIYNVADEEIDKLKQNIRHELIHYALRVSGLKSADNSAVFHVLCNQYDANPYMEMAEDEKLLFDEWVNIVKLSKSIFTNKNTGETDEVEAFSSMLKFALLGLGGSDNSNFASSYDSLQKCISSYSHTLNMCRDLINKYMCKAS